jgi:hypothetical protein
MKKQIDPKWGEAYRQAGKENKTARKLLILAVILLVPVTAIALCFRASVLAPVTSFLACIPFMLCLEYGCFIIKRKQSRIAHKIVDGV